MSTIRWAAGGAPPQRRRASKPTEHTYLASLEAGSDRPEIQRIIREAVQRGTIRVVPDRASPDKVVIVRIVSEKIPSKLPSLA
jgi:hypothetical protein